MDETIFVIRAERNKKKQLAQSLPTEGGLEALDWRWRVQPLEPTNVPE
jgi:hypothetical protein